MFNKVKKMIKGEKGFTLVELLAVIVILGIIVAIAIPAIGNVISQADEDADEATQSMIVDAARLYEMQEYTGDDDAFSVSVGTLLTEGYLEERQGSLDELSEKEVTKNTDGEFLFDGEPVGAGDDDEG